MLRIDRVVIWTLMAMYVMAIPSISLVKFLDEAVLYSMFVVVFAHCLALGHWRRYLPLWWAIAIIAGYVLYSVTCVHFNTASAVIQGAIIEFKPFLAILIPYCVAPELTEGDKRLGRVLVFCIMGFVVCSLPLWSYSMHFIYAHNALYGSVCMLSAIFFLVCSIRPDGQLSTKDKLWIVAFLLLGLLCTRSKYYAEFVFFLFFLFIYTPGFLRHLKLSHIFLIGAVLVAVALVVSQKFMYYFGAAFSSASLFDLNSRESFARVALYGGMILVLMDFPLLGSGFASFASFASSVPYSSLYARYGLDKVWGLQPSAPDFISDAYYASLAQFGLVGIALFIYFWTWGYKKLRPLARIGQAGKYYFVAGAMICIVVLVELTTGTIIFQPPGVCICLLLGILAARGARLPKKEKTSRQKSLQTIRIR